MLQLFPPKNIFVLLFRVRTYWGSRRGCSSLTSSSWCSNSRPWVSPPTPDRGCLVLVQYMERLALGTSIKPTSYVYTPSVAGAACKSPPARLPSIPPDSSRPIAPLHLRPSAPRLLLPILPFLRLCLCPCLCLLLCLCPCLSVSMRVRGVWGECAREANDPAAHTGVRRQRVQARGSMGVEGRHRKGKGPDAMGGTEARTYTCTCNTCNACTCNTCNTWVAQRRGSAGPTLRVSIKEEGGSEEGGKTEHGQRKGARQMTGSLTGPQLQPPACARKEREESEKGVAWRCHAAIAWGVCLLLVF